jgi:hypothetical protein
MKKNLLPQNVNPTIQRKITKIPQMPQWQTQWVSTKQFLTKNQISQTKMIILNLLNSFQKV